MSTRRQSWDRLSGEAWLSDSTVQRAMAVRGATAQRLAGGAFSLIKDEYRIEILSFPPSLTAESLIEEFADNPNAAVSNGQFNSNTTFNRRPRGTPPTVGDMYILNFWLFGVNVDDGAIVTVMQSPGFGGACSRPESWFIIQASSTEAEGDMPEFGAREFGIERDGSRTFFYTRGASRGADFLRAVAGKIPQQRLWFAAMNGVRDRIRAAGGQANETFERNYEVTPWS